MEGLAGLTAEQLKAARQHAALQKISLMESILKLGLVGERELLLAAAEMYGLEFIDISTLSFEEHVLNIACAHVTTYYHVMPIKITDTNILWVATSNPFQANFERELELVLDVPYKVKFVLSTHESIKNAIRKYYGVGAATVEKMVANERLDENVSQLEDLTVENQARDASVIKLVNQILADAINAGSTDIHFEPHEDNLRVRYRTDGILHDSGVPASVRLFRDGIISRIKILAGLDIAEKRLPQDGRAQVNISGRKYDLRVSVLPTRFSEAVNIRILPRGTLISDLPGLGIPERDVKKLNMLIRKPHGIILLTGPTGSGKTTTLYTCMNLLNRIDNKILTIEDPIEYNMAGLVQMQVHPAISFTFARALRAILRHDPDIILVGEIRDLETAETAIRTALTGHLVFSTLHTNDAASALTRLMDMGIEPFLAASSIEAILAQRLVRVICSNCREQYQPDAEIITAIKSLTDLPALPEVYHGRGCQKCRFSGFHGRTVITEMLMVTEEIRQLTIHRSHANEIDAMARRQGMTNLFDSGIEKVHQGMTTYEEVLRVTKGTVLIDGS